MVKICVLGAGVVGMTTAVKLQKELPSAEVTVAAEQFTPDTLSDGAGGIFRPGSSFSGPTEQITRQWIVDSYLYYDEIRNSVDGPRAGVAQMSGYIFSSKYPSLVQNDFLEGLVPLYRPVTTEELTLCPGNWKYGSFFTTLVAECYKLLPWLTERFDHRGGKCERRKVSALQDLAGQYDVVVNCAGFGAKYLCNDRLLTPVRGQVFKVKAPWIKNFFYGDYDTYIIPGSEMVTMGGVRQYDSYNESVDSHDSAAIWERCTNLVPSLSTAQVQRQWVGLRPHRNPVRVEKEVITTGHKPLKVVHEYGHGGYGVTVAPGTANSAVKMVKEMLTGNYNNLHHSRL